MKRILVSLLSFFLCSYVFAQVDFRMLEGKTPLQIKALYGAPLVDDGSLNSYSAYVLFYENTHFYFEELTDPNDSNDTIWLLYDFSTCSPDICILSDYINGGIKVGDSFARLSSIDFAHTAYGRNLSSNALQVSTLPYEEYSYEMNYVAFKEEFVTLYFAVTDGIIRAISVSTKGDSPYPPGFPEHNIW